MNFQSIFAERRGQIIIGLIVVAFIGAGAVFWFTRDTRIQAHISAYTAYTRHGPGQPKPAIIIGESTGWRAANFVLLVRSRGGKEVRLEDGRGISHELLTLTNQDDQLQVQIADLVLDADNDPSASRFEDVRLANSDMVVITINGSKVKVPLDGKVYVWKSESGLSECNSIKASDITDCFSGKGSSLEVSRAFERAFECLRETPEEPPF